MFSFLGYKSLNGDLLPPLEQVFKASRTAQQGPSLLFCLLSVPSTPLLIPTIMSACMCVMKKNPIYTRKQEEAVTKVCVLSLVSVLSSRTGLTKCSDNGDFILLLALPPSRCAYACVSVVDVVWT